MSVVVVFFTVVRASERILAYLHMNWATMRQNEAVVSAMRATKLLDQAMVVSLMMAALEV